jgi:ribonuclease-3
MASSISQKEGPRRDSLSSDSDDSRLTECQQVLGYHFQEPGLLVRALTHSSIARTRLESNERLEFLGDAILGAVVCEQLYSFYPDATEGEMTRIKSVVVSRATCALLTRRLGLDRFLILGRGVDAQGRLPGSIMAAVFEAVVGAIYVDGGFEPARTFVLMHIEPVVQQAAESETGVNFKSLLQQLSQRTSGETPTYTVLDEQGPDHSKCFKVAAVVGSRLFPAAWGPSKKEAEQRAAGNALAELDGDELPFPDEEMA